MMWKHHSSMSDVSFVMISEALLRAVLLIDERQTMNELVVCQ